MTKLTGHSKHASVYGLARLAKASPPSNSEPQCCDTRTKWLTGPTKDTANQHSLPSAVNCEIQRESHREALSDVVDEKSQENREP